MYISPNRNANADSHVRVPTSYALPRKALYVLVPGTRGVWGPGTEQTAQGKLTPLLQSLLIVNGMQPYALTSNSRKTGSPNCQLGGLLGCLSTKARAIGIALDPHLAHKWRQGGSLIHRARGTDIKDRMIGISIPNKGWKPGLLLISIYAPLTNRSSLALRDNFREQLSLLLDKASRRVTPILGGDFNREVGPTKDKLWTQVLGPSKGGEELLNFCEQEGLVVANTFSSQKHKATWYHNRWGTAHALDHFLVRSAR